MHPNGSFRWTDEPAMRAFVAARGFATICAKAPEGPVLAHAPLVVTGAGMLGFHVARGNRIRRHLDGATVMVSVTGDDFYVSPDWYGTPDQVPTWNYCAVEIEGRASALDDAALVDQLDSLSATFEATLAPKPAWTRDKMKPDRFESMLPASQGFELVPTAWRGTRKLGQNKTAAERAAMAGALEAIGRHDAAALVRSA